MISKGKRCVKGEWGGKIKEDFESMQEPLLAKMETIAFEKALVFCHLTTMYQLIE